MLPAEIELTRSRLRPWRLSDRGSLLRSANDRAVWRNLRDRFPHPYTERHADDWFAFAAADPPPVGVYAIEVDGDAVGTIALEPGSDIERWCWEIGYWLGRAYWGRGIATEAVTAVIDRVVYARTRDTGLPYAPFVIPESSTSL